MFKLSPIPSLGWLGGNFVDAVWHRQSGARHARPVQFGGTTSVAAS